jgi:type I restriction enzyme S subunit
MDLKTGYKQTEIGVIPEDWEVKTLGDVGDVKMCRRVFNHETTSNGTIPFYKIGTFGKEADAYISKDLYNDYRQRFSFPNKGDILISAAGTIGRTIIFDGKDSYFQDSNIVWIDNKNSIISNDFLYYVFQVVKYQTEGGTIQRLYNSILKATKFVCPTKPEQTAIATALSDADGLITGLEKLIAKKRNIKQGAMQQLLQPKEGWEVKKLGEVSDLITKGTTPTSVGREFQNKGINFIKIESLQKNGEIVKDKVAFIDEFTHNLLKRSQLKSKDILFSIAGALGRVAIVKDEILPANTNQALAIIRLKDGYLVDYIYFYLNNEKIQKYILTISVQGAQANLSLLNISELDIPFPALEEQTRIASVLTDMDAELSALEQKLEKYKKVKLGMMQELLTGKTRLV